MNADAMSQKIGALAAVALTFTMTTAGIAQTDRYDRRIVVRNMSDSTIERFHATNTGIERWGRDHLGRDVLRPGQETTIDLNDGSGYCRFDFLTMTDGGQRIVRRNVDVCTASSYTLR
jgi:hypothetical protein